MGEKPKSGAWELMRLVFVIMTTDEKEATTKPMNEWLDGDNVLIRILPLAGFAFINMVSEK